MYFVFRVRRHAEREEVLESDEQAARRELVVLGDGIRGYLRGTAAGRGMIDLTRLGDGLSRTPPGLPAGDEPVAPPSQAHG